MLPANTLFVLYSLYILADDSDLDYYYHIIQLFLKSFESQPFSHLVTLRFPTTGALAIAH